VRDFLFGTKNQPDWGRLIKPVSINNYGRAAKPAIGTPAKIIKKFREFKIMDGLTVLFFRMRAPVLSSNRKVKRMQSNVRRLIFFAFWGRFLAGAIFFLAAGAAFFAFPDGRAKVFDRFSQIGAQRAQTLGAKNNDDDG
jgi:hypothetical protein